MDNTAVVITPEQQITNLISVLGKYAAQKPFDGQLAEIRTMLRDLSEDWQSYQRGELKPVAAESAF